ncbi:MAG: GerAB/ArcD/ProY family transporter [Eubacteriales bacterium]|nr:GerAB/ArcD/ProY family transporter [Eubacteriales bacterium]
MLGKNGKISLHQLKCLLFAEWIGKMCLLMPLICRSLKGWNYAAAIAVGCVWTLLYSALLLKTSTHVQDKFTDYMTERLGKWFAYAAAAMFLAYLVCSQIYLARLTARICRVFLLPGLPEEIFCAALVLAGTVTAAGGKETRARAAECLVFFIGVVLAVMLAASACAVRMENITNTQPFMAFSVLERGAAVSAAFAGMALLLYETPYIQWKKEKRGRELGKVLGLLFLFLIAAAVIAMGVLGEKSFSLLPWPLVTLMSSAELPGGFLQRWDAVFLSVLLFSLFLDSGAASHYICRILGEAVPKRKEAHIRYVSGAAVLFLTLACRTYEAAEAIFFKWVLCCLAPLTAAVPVLLFTLERIKRKCEKQGH